jgi:UDP-N-acetylglucosamine:LPS N-acetylglucosamine transferase
MFGRKEAAQVIRDTELERELLVNRVKSILTSNTLLQSMGEAARTFGKPDATQDIVAEVVRMADTKAAKTQKQKHEVVSI